MKLATLKQWICDDCGQLIEKPEDGWLEWKCLRDGDHQFDYRIVHQIGASPQKDSRSRGCYYSTPAAGSDYHVQDMHLEHFMGVDGLGILLSLWEDNPQKDSHQICEVIRRLHTPNWETARQYLATATSDGMFYGEDPSHKYLQTSISNIISRYGRD